MSGLLDFFSGKKEHKNSENILNDYDNPAKLARLKNEKLDRARFKISDIATIGWWPDEMIKFIEVIRLMYRSFIQSIPKKPDKFDIPLRNAILFMNQDPYCKNNEIKKYIFHHSTIIRENYWTKVMEEDNCLMDDYEDRFRSSKKLEDKHYLLFRACTQLLQYPDISYGDVKIKDEYIKDLYVYVSLYKIKIMLPVLDEAFRKLIRGLLDNDLREIQIPELLGKIIMIDYTEILNFALKSKNNDVINNVYIIHDILLYGLYRSTQVHFVFNSQKSTFNPYNMNSHTSLNIFSLYEDYKKIFDTHVINRISYVYNVYVQRLENGYKNVKLIIKTNDFNTLIQSSNGITKNRTITPRYMVTTTNDTEILLINNQLKSNDINKIDAHRKYRSSSANNIIKKR